MRRSGKTTALRRDNACVIESVALEEQGFTGRPCERVSETIAEIQFGGMSAAFSEIAIGLARNPRLSLSHWLDDDLCLPDKIIKTPASDGIATSVNHKGGFYEVCRREATGDILFNRDRADLCVQFVG